MWTQIHVKKSVNLHWRPKWWWYAGMNLLKGIRQPGDVLRRSTNSLENRASWPANGAAAVGCWGQTWMKMRQFYIIYFAEPKLRRAWLIMYISIQWKYCESTFPNRQKLIHLITPIFKSIVTYLIGQPEVRQVGQGRGGTGWSWGSRSR